MAALAGSVLRRFLQSGAAGGILLMGAALLALIAANTDLETLYHDGLHAPVGPSLAPGHGPMSVHVALLRAESAPTKDLH